MAQGRRIDLAGCFQEVSGPWAFTPCNYYPLLAGLVRTQGMAQVLEVGTKYGGAILAVRRGLVQGLASQPVLVTVDVEEHQGHGLLAHPEITRILGDAAGAATIARVAECFRPPIDMLYLDAVHTREHTRACFDSYTAALNPRFVLVDDIFLNASMRVLWEELAAEFPPEQVFDATELTGRGSECGFGVIEYRRT
jgi:cephalosporin hydroxylase